MALIFSSGPSSVFTHGESFGIRSLSLWGLSLKSEGSSTVTQHGGVQKMSTRKNMLPKLRKRKRRELQKQ